MILVGDDPASATYVRSKQRNCEACGINSERIHFEESVSESRLLAEIDRLNEDDQTDGILVQLPLPEHIDEKKVINRILPEKDVDGFHPVNIGKMMTGQDAFIPCTPHGIVTLLQYEGVEIAGKHVVVIGRSNIVGKPVGQLLLNENATVTYCHSQTKNLRKLTKQADILVVAAGKEKLIGAEDVREGAIVIDVGIHRDENGKLVGDVDFHAVSQVASHITPVPGGVGPMTIAMLLENTVKAAQKRIEKR